MLGESRARLHQHQLRSAFRHGFEYASEVVSGVYLERLHLQIERRCTLGGWQFGWFCAFQNQGQFAAIASVGPSLGVEVSPINVRNVDEIKDAISAFARVPNGGLIVTASGAALEHREQIVTFAERHKLPAVYYERLFVDAGGLISYGADYADQYHQAAGYVDRILKGEKPADLPVQVPTKYELVINLKTAKGLDLTIPPSVLARAHEVIE